MGPVVQSASSAEKYYYEKDPFNKDNSYYLGGGCQNLGIEVGAPVKGNDLKNLLYGRNLESEQIVKSSYSGKDRTDRRGGVDFTLDDPKGVTNLERLCGYDFKDIRRNSASKTADIVDKNFIYYRETQNGNTQSVHAPGQAIIACFEHSISRENDPQSHTHMFIFNNVHTKTQDYKAIDTKPIFINQKFITAVYHSEMARQLVEMGIPIEQKGNGLYDIAGVPREINDLFSKRRHEIVKAEKELIESGKLPFANKAEINRVATLDTRPNKETHITKEELIESWNKQINDRGYCKEDILKGISAAKEKQQESENLKSKLSAKDYVQFALKDLEKSESTFSKEHLQRNALNLSLGKFGIDDIQNAFRQILTKGSIKQVASNVYATPEMIKTETSILTHFEEGRNVFEPLMSSDEAHSFIKGFENRHNIILTEGQRNLVIAVTTSSDMFILAQGNAGTGKTTVFKAITEAASSKGIEVQGYSKTGKAVKEFLEATGAEARTVDSELLLRSSDSFRQQTNTIKVIDEASVLGSQQTYEMIKTAIEDNSRLILIGDVKQLQALDAGRIFQDAQSKGDINVVRLTESLRQKSDYTKELVSELASIPDAQGNELNAKWNNIKSILDRHNSFFELSDRSERLEAAVGSYINQDRIPQLICQTNADKLEINNLVREYLKDKGTLNNEHELTVRTSQNLIESDKRYASNYSENSIAFAQKALPGMHAGDEARITGIDSENNIIHCESKTGNSFSIDTTTYGTRLQSFSESNKFFSEGDQVIFTKNDRMHNVQNGLTGTIIDISKDNTITVELNNGKEIIFNAESYNYIDHSYAITDYKSQGSSYNSVILIGSSDKANYNQLYVSASRSQHDFKMFVDDKSAFFENAREFQEKTSTLDYTFDHSETGIQSKSETLEHVHKGASHEV